MPVRELSIRPETRGFVDWHNSRFPAFVITIEGDLEVEVSDGTKLALPPSKVAFLEDNSGKGHITRTRDVVNLFVAVAPGLGIRKWAKSENSGRFSADFPLLTALKPTRSGAKGPPSAPPARGNRHWPAREAAPAAPRAGKT